MDPGEFLGMNIKTNCKTWSQHENYSTTVSAWQTNIYLIQLYKNVIQVFKLIN